VHTHATLVAVESIPRVLIFSGLLLALVGLALHFAPGLPFLGKLPGDIRIDRPGFKLVFPIATCLLLSAVVSGVIWLFSKLR
jgi:hypothetical protein